MKIEKIPMEVAPVPPVYPPARSHENHLDCEKRTYRRALVAKKIHPYTTVSSESDGPAHRLSGLDSKSRPRRERPVTAEVISCEKGVHQLGIHSRRWHGAIFNQRYIGCLSLVASSPLNHRIVATAWRRFPLSSTEVEPPEPCDTPLDLYWFSCSQLT